MLTIKNVLTVDGNVVDHTIDSAETYTFDAQGVLTMLPALIDPHVHFRTPGHEHKEDWSTGARAALAGGVTTVCDMPNNKPACITERALEDKQHLIDDQLKDVGIPLHHYLYFGATKTHLAHISEVCQDVVGLKVFMGSSTGDLLITEGDTLDEVFAVAARYSLPVAVHAEDEDRLKQRKALFAGSSDPSTHSKIRDRQAAAIALERAVVLCAKHGARLYALHISTREELDIIREAKRQGFPVFAETTPHHLFLNEGDYSRWGTQVQANPPIRTADDQKALWEGIADGTIDTIGSDHAPHTLEEKARPYPQAPSGIPGIETTLPLLLDAYSQGKLPLDKVIAITRTRVAEILDLPDNTDIVLVDLNAEKTVDRHHLKTKCGWSPFEGRTLHGWPTHTVLRGHLYDINNL